MSKIKTIHTSRTMMFAELEKVMACSMDSNDHLEALKKNVTGKKSSSGVEYTASFLRRLYAFDPGSQPFQAFRYFWIQSEPQERPLIALVYAVSRDALLAESIEVLKKIEPGKKANVDLFEDQIERHHPNGYSANTRRSMAQNIASSWKQAGFISGKVKNIRVQPVISSRVAAFAFLLAYLNGDHGDFTWNNPGVQALCLPLSSLRELAVDAARRGLLQYQFAGNVTAFNFTKLINTIQHDGNKN